MNRVEFTKKLAALLSQMVFAGEMPILDYVKRSAEEQKRLFDEGKSKCDGLKVVSMHQYGKAADIYFLSEPDRYGKVGLCDPISGFEYWHQVWKDMGGAEMIEWDKGHFEG